MGMKKRPTPERDKNKRDLRAAMCKKAAPEWWIGPLQYDEVGMFLDWTGPMFECGDLSTHLKHCLVKSMDLDPGWAGSFCGRSSSQVLYGIENPNVCADCIAEVMRRMVSR